MSNTEYNPFTTQSGKKKSTSGSWVVERDALRQFADRKTRAILAIFTARRSSGKEEFFVSPHIAELYRLTPRDLNWAFEQLEGEFISTVESKSGKFRLIRLTQEWEARETQRAKGAPKPTGNDGSDEELVVIDKEKVAKQLEQLPVTTDEQTIATLCELAKESKASGVKIV